MKFFKSLFVTAFFAFTSLGCLNAQEDLGQAFELYNSAIKALQESQYTQAINDIEKALQVVSAITDDEQAIELKANCEKIIPQVYLSYARLQASIKQYAEALEILDKVKELADKYDNIDVLVSAEDFIPQVYTVKGTADVEEGNIAEGIAAYRKALELDKDNSTIYLYIAAAQLKANDEAEAIVNFDQIIAMEGAKESDKATAQKQGATIFLKRAAAAQPAKQWKEVYENEQKASEYDNTNISALKLLGLSSVELKKWKDAITAYEVVLAADPNAKDKNNTIYRLAIANENLNNKTKACSYYKQLVNDAGYKDIAKDKMQKLCQ
jgi:tetratricopeptide (TPR) repeat protein